MNKVKEFCNEVKALAEKYDLSFFMVSEGASVTKNKDCAAVRAARLAHEKWEKEQSEKTEEE